MKFISTKKTTLILCVFAVITLIIAFTVLGTSKESSFINDAPSSTTNSIEEKNLELQRTIDFHNTELAENKRNLASLKRAHDTLNSQFAEHGEFNTKSPPERAPIEKLPNSPEAKKASRQRLESKQEFNERIAKQTGMSIDEVSEMFDEKSNDDEGEPSTKTNSNQNKE